MVADAVPELGMMAVINIRLNLHNSDAENHDPSMSLQ